MTFGPEGGEAADKGVWMSIWVDDVDTIYQHCLAQGLEVTWTNEIDQAIARAKTAPGEVAPLASQMITVLERQRVRLIRHQAR